jgi:hypothetical protein
MKNRDTTNDPELYGGKVYAYGCQPYSPTDKTNISEPWLPIAPTPPPSPVYTILSPPKECERCHHLFATVEGWNAHIDECVEKHKCHVR